MVERGNGKMVKNGKMVNANGKKSCYIVQQFHWANKRDVTLRHL